MLAKSSTMFNILYQLRALVSYGLLIKGLNMKKKFYLYLPAIALATAGAFCLLFLVGCQESAKKDKSNRIVVESGGKFPKFLAGTWKADRFIWQIEFATDGQMLSVVYVTWSEKIDLKQGYIYDEGKEEGDYAYFVLGPCEGTYNPATRELKVKLNMKEYEIRLAGVSLKGRSDDYIEGTISEDGTKWEADWRGYSYLEGAALPDVNYINENPEKIVFSKIDNK
jgi:hypothetical protein